MKFADEKDLIAKSKMHGGQLVIHISGGCLQDVWYNGKEVKDYILVDMDGEKSDDYGTPLT